MEKTSKDQTQNLSLVLHYHQATKHHPYRSATGPGYLDWDTQPDPFRNYQGAPRIALKKIQTEDTPQYDHIYQKAQITPAPLNHSSISQIFYDSLAISAWKTYGESTWALRVNPSSGNLHPTEGYLICGPIQALCEKPMV